MDFKTRTLGDICDEGGGIIKTGPFGTQLHQSDYKNEGVPVIMPKNIKQGKVSVDDIARIGNQDVSRLSNHRLKKGDIIYGRRGDIGRRALIGDRENGWLCGTGCLRLNLGNLVLDPVFLYYYLGQSQVISWIYNQAIGATMPNLNTDIIRSIPISYPPFPTQRKIAAILSAYDDLIENNTRRIKILEEMAQALYREWFVKFRFPGHEKVKMVESELGVIPEGWLNNYSEFVNFLEGPGLRKWQYKESGIPFLNIRTLVGNDIDFSKVKYIDKDEVKKKYKHFLLEPHDHVVSSSGTIGRIVTIQNWHLPLMLNTSIIRMRPNTASVGKWQLKHFLQSEYFQNQIRAHATGAAQMNFGPSHLKQMWIIAPSEEIGQKYEKITGPMEELICKLVQKNVNLHRTRDLLLPKLISGEVDVSNLTIGTGK